MQEVVAAGRVVAVDQIDVRRVDAGVDHADLDARAAKAGVVVRAGADVRHAPGVVELGIGCLDLAVELDTGDAAIGGEGGELLLAHLDIDGAGELVVMADVAAVSEDEAVFLRRVAGAAAIGEGDEDADRARRGRGGVRGPVSATRKRRGIPPVWAKQRRRASDAARSSAGRSERIVTGRLPPSSQGSSIPQRLGTPTLIPGGGGDP